MKKKLMPADIRALSLFSLIHIKVMRMKIMFTPDIAQQAIKKSDVILGSVALILAS